MRLRKVNVSGFKSFVDPTSIDLPSDLIGIVGPNGCGKSNVIDAVRWVMGESSARHLRGAQMADVIFNGSNTRKPVGQAQVELIFDNSDGRMGDRFAAYTDISVKRTVGREGTSQYTLNGTRCRRRDITDLFLGTGLGPRSYAVIEQGMISRLIEARPEELRDYLEEVAGISRYKERRRETENRIRHTREHLERLTDVREELTRQLQRLDRQARQAERYKVLKAEERELHAQLLALRWRTLNDAVGACGTEVSQAATVVESTLAELRASEAEIERNREAERIATDAANAAYRDVLEASSAVTRTESAIANFKRQRDELGESLEREGHALEQARARLGSDEQQLGDIDDSLRRAEPELERLEDTVAVARENYADQERRMHDWQARWQELAGQAEEPGKTANGERARIDALEERLRQLAEREARLTRDRATIDLAALTSARDGASASTETQRSQEQAASAALAESQGARELAREAARAVDSQVHELRARQQQLHGAHASLEALQRDALGDGDTDRRAWLATHGLADAPRVASAVRVVDGWASAVETVLGETLEHLGVEDIDEGHIAALAALERGSAGIVDMAGGAGRTPEPGGAVTSGTPLLSLVAGPDAVIDLLQGVFVASDPAAALALSGELAPGQSVVTPDGFRAGRGWLRASASARADGVLVRMERLRELDAQIASGSDALVAAEDRAEQARTALRSAETQVNQLQQQANDAQRRLVSAEAETSLRQRDLDQARERHDGFVDEQAEIDQRRTQTQEELGAARRRLGEATEQLQQIEGERQRWNASRDEHRQQLEQARNHWQQVRDEGYQLGLKVESWRTRLKALQDSRARNREEAQRLEERVQQVRQQRETLSEPLADAESQLQTQIGAHRQTEATLSAKRDEVQAAQAHSRGLQARRNEANAAVETARETLNARQLAAQETTVRRDTVNEQLADSGRTPEDWLTTLAEAATEAEWSTRVEDMGRRISRLGAINLAAIDEHQELGERKEYLDAQHADLEEALETLESAMRRIDRETRNRFKDTFEKVNTGLADRFPKLFGGGRAYLQLTSEDVLEAGVSVMAQPPGKRNSSIQLLSGGEKALTAVALVFAMFDLNPAPFCLLDEVDAPLDDANVARFSDLVGQMSEQVQMLVVTHNKVTMEVMQQLIGVTMQEPGVSRLVAVDINDAVAFAEA
ncbi:MAG: chromosome segregation protein SMC [Pseudomonadota bacterium]